MKEKAMTRRIPPMIAAACAMLVCAAPASADPWGADQNQAIVRVSPDLADRAAAARQSELSIMLDRRERSLTAKSVAAAPVARDPVRDDRFRIGQPSVPAPAVAGSNREIEWLQVGVGFGVGALLVTALLLALRAPVRRPAAH
jgi:hypothetical protein